MKRLYILRHAKSSWAERGSGDIDRRLNERGHEQMRTLSKWWSEWRKSDGNDIDCAIVSIANRTRETFADLEQALGFSSPQFLDDLYMGTIEDYLDTLWAQAGDSVLLIGHNPTCDELARYLASPNSPAADKLMAQHFSTASMAVFDCDIEEWSELGRYKGRLLDFIRPKDLESN